jgi:hypothetical protein
VLPLCSVCYKWNLGFLLGVDQESRCIADYYIVEEEMHRRYAPYLDVIHSQFMWKVNTRISIQYSLSSLIIIVIDFLDIFDHLFYFIFY